MNYLTLPQEAKKAIQQLQGLFSAIEMQRLNSIVFFQKKNFKEIAQTFLVEKSDKKAKI